MKRQLNISKPDKYNDAVTSDNDNSPVNTAHELVTSDEIVIYPLQNADQGPKYRGLYASYAREEADPKMKSLLLKYQVQLLKSGQRVLDAQADV